MSDRWQRGLVRRQAGRLGLLAAVVVCLLGLATCADARRRPHQRWLELSHPINPAQELNLPFGTRSQWLQPWRGYLDTPPAARLSNGLGINFNVTNAAEANATAAALQRAGFHRARVEIGWSSLDPNHPTSLSPYAGSQMRTILSALFRHGLRPLILLNANAGQPTPVKPVTLHILAPAVAGTRQVILDPASAAQIVPGRTGFNSLTGGYQQPAELITAVTGAVATLAAPLPRTLTLGNYPGSTLAYAPFTDPTSAGFSSTLAGWLSYVQTVASFARSVGGSNRFDIEVWNEISFGSDFLNINNYYAPAIDPNAPASGQDTATTHALLSATAKLIFRRFPGVQVGDGFSDQTPYVSGQTELPGVQIDKHYYNGMQVFPQDDGPIGVKPVDWLGRPFATYSKINGADHWNPFWVPTYSEYFPEYWLSGLQTETLIRDLSPLPGENVYRAPHGRFTHPPGAPPPQIWMTEYNLDRVPSPMLTPVQAQRFQAKVVLRYLTAFINKGLGAVYFFGAQGGLGLLPDSFYSSIGKTRHPAPGLTLDALGRMTQRIGSAPRMRRRSVKLLQIATTDRRTVFAGSGPYPPLRNLDAAAFFPFQETTHRFVFLAYVMTRNLLRAWQRPGPHEYDMPAGLYRFKVGNVSGCETKLSAYDPLAGRSVSVKRTACTTHTLTFQTRLTDSPILIQANGA